MADTLTEFARKMDRLAAIYERIPRDVAAASARVYTTSIRSSINSVTAGGRLRGVGKNGTSIGARYNVLGASGGGTASALVQGTGPLHLIERDNADHDIPRTQGSRRLRTASGRLSRKRVQTSQVLSGRRLLVINGRVITGPVHVRGSKGKHPFERGVDAAQFTAADAAERVVTQGIASVFGR